LTDISQAVGVLIQILGLERHVHMEAGAQIAAISGPDLCTCMYAGVYACVRVYVCG
jgi:hypothetical protein